VGGTGVAVFACLCLGVLVLVGSTVGVSVGGVRGVKVTSGVGVSLVGVGKGAVAVGSTGVSVGGTVVGVNVGVTAASVGAVVGVSVGGTDVDVGVAVGVFVGSLVAVGGTAVDVGVAVGVGVWVGLGARHQAKPIARMQNIRTDMVLFTVISFFSVAYATEVVNGSHNP